MSKILFLDPPEAEKLIKTKWLQFLETPCIYLFKNVLDITFKTLYDLYSTSQISDI